MAKKATKKPTKKTLKKSRGPRDWAGSAVVPSAKPTEETGEIIVGLVGAVGIKLRGLIADLEEVLGRFDYSTESVNLIEQAWKYVNKADPPILAEDIRIQSFMDFGDKIREETKVASAIVNIGLQTIREKRQKLGGDPEKPLARTAFILKSLKRPEEVQLLRKIYGQRFLLISAYEPLSIRRNQLLELAVKSYDLRDRPEDLESKIERLIERDQDDQRKEWGQKVRKTFHLADLFIDVTAPVVKDQLKRFFDMVFGYPYHTPTQDEYAMFHAWAAASRSAALSRQVGAVVATTDGDIISVGCNEVPRAGGGLYWEGNDDDERDFRRGQDPSDEWRRRILSEVIEGLRKNHWLSRRQVGKKPEELVTEALPILREEDARVTKLNEFNRTVHAEMAALIDAARRGAAVKTAVLYTTTFPCHECTRHIVAAGIGRVIYVEPYPKSAAKDLHLDSIVIDPSEEEKLSWVGRHWKVAFQPFVGLAPTQYLAFFDHRGKERKDETGKAIQWTSAKANLRYPTALNYPALEKGHIAGFSARYRTTGSATRP